MYVLSPLRVILPPNVSMRDTELNYPVFWIITQREVVCKRRFGTTYRSHLQELSCSQVKVKPSLEQAMKAHRWGRRNVLIAVLGMVCQGDAPSSLLPKQTQYPSCRRLGGPQSRSVRERKILPPQGFDSRTVQPVVNRYTNYSIPAQTLCSDRVQPLKHITFAKKMSANTYQES